jgi:hypothetical protein
MILLAAGSVQTADERMKVLLSHRVTSACHDQGTIMMVQWSLSNCCKHRYSLRDCGMYRRLHPLAPLSWTKPEQQAAA